MQGLLGFLAPEAAPAAAPAPAAAEPDVEVAAEPEPQKPSPIKIGSLSLNMAAVPERDGAKEFDRLASVGGMTNRVQARLIMANQVQRARRLRVTGGSLLCGFILMFGGLGGMFVLTGVISNLFMAVAALGCWFAVLGILPTDRRAIRTLSCLMVAASGFVIYNASSYAIPRWSNWSTDGCHTGGALGTFCIAQALRYNGDVLLYIVTFLTSLETLRPTLRRGKCAFAHMPRKILFRQWLVLKTLFGVEGSIWVITTILYIVSIQTTDPTLVNYEPSGVPIGSIISGSGFLVVSALCTRVPRTAVKAFLASLGADAESASNAAGVAAVMGGLDVPTALARGSDSFRAVSFDDLAFESLDSNVAAPELASKSKHARLGAVDYFLSHSWVRDGRARGNRGRTARGHVARAPCIRVPCIVSARAAAADGPRRVCPCAVGCAVVLLTVG